MHIARFGFCLHCNNSVFFFWSGILVCSPYMTTIIFYAGIFYFIFLGQSCGWWFNLLLLPGRRSNLALSKHCGLHNRCLVFLSCVSVYVCMSLLMHVCVCAWCECVLQATDVVLLVPLGFQRVYKYVNVQWENTRTVRFPLPHTPRGSVDLFITFCEGVSRFVLLSVFPHKCHFPSTLSLLSPCSMQTHFPLFLIYQKHW